MSLERIREIIDAIEAPANKLLLAYDAKTAKYENDSAFKEDLINFLKSKEAKEVMSSVASTLYFVSTKLKPLEFWSNELAIKYGAAFSFSLVLISKDGNSYLHVDYPIDLKKRK